LPDLNIETVDKLFGLADCFLVGRAFNLRSRASDFVATEQCVKAIFGHVEFRVLIANDHRTPGSAMGSNVRYRMVFLYVRFMTLRALTSRSGFCDLSQWRVFVLIIALSGTCST
jgi:hypothetical protein